MKLRRYLWDFDQNIRDFNQNISDFDQNHQDFDIKMTPPLLQLKVNINFVTGSFFFAIRLKQIFPSLRLFSRGGWGVSGGIRYELFSGRITCLVPAEYYWGS